MDFNVTYGDNKQPGKDSHLGKNVDETYCTTEINVKQYRCRILFEQRPGRVNAMALPSLSTEFTLKYYMQKHTDLSVYPLSTTVTVEIC